MVTSTIKAEHTSHEIFSWLKNLPLAPEYHPTIQEFQDPISYIFKIEKEASKYGICKIVPPLSAPSKKSVISNFNNSISSSKGVNSRPTFTTRVQQVGFSSKKPRSIEKSVWQSGEDYTLLEFEAKAKNFERGYLRNRGKKGISPLEVETLYWKAHGGRPFSVEYANDMAGSCFVEMREKKRGGVALGVNVGDTSWNMRGVARAKGSLLRYMKENIPGVTSPMVYVAMMFSWFAWHVEDHDLHSLNYLHLGGGKTWYGVPRDAAAAFEEVVRVHGFGEEINPLVTFATLGEKTMVLSPEVLMAVGVPCCRLVQNAGEFVVTFPRAYHSGFSHGFNCGEASNIATPEWLRFAKDAAIRRASINYPPMVSHFQLLYDFALAICTRAPMVNNDEPRSSRLKDKKSEGEMLVKQMFVQDVMQSNELLYSLGQGCEVVLLPHNASEKFVWSNLRVGSKYKVKPGLPFSLYSSEEAIKASDDIMLARNVKQPKTSCSVNGKLSTRKCNGVRSQSSSGSMCTPQHEEQLSDTEKGGAAGDGLSDRGLFSCVKCGIWTFACVAIIQPTESAAQYLMSADSSFLHDWVAGPGVLSHGIDASYGEAPSDPDAFSGSVEKSDPCALYGVSVQSTDYQAQNLDNNSTMKSATSKTTNMRAYNENKMESSALGLLAMAYGNSTDSDEDNDLPNCHAVSDENISGDGSPCTRFNRDTVSPTSEQGYDSAAERSQSLIFSRSEYDSEDSPGGLDLYGHHIMKKANSDGSEYEVLDSSAKFIEEGTTSEQVHSFTVDEIDTGKLSNANYPVGKPNFGLVHGCDEDSSRMHVFCLEHAVEVERLLRPIGGVHILLLCHPDYPKVQIEARKVAEELDMDYVWKDITFSEAMREDEQQIQLALQTEEATPKNGDWAVKLGINLFYSAILSRSPLYNKQMPYNSVIYGAFGCNSPYKSSPEANVRGKGVGRRKKLVVAGKWCGKVWMSNQVHPLLVQRDPDDEERSSDACFKPDEKLGTKSETNKKVHSASMNRKTGRKRKSTESKSVKKMQIEAKEFTDTDPEDCADDRPKFEPRRSIRKSKTLFRPIMKVKHQEEMQESDSEEDSLNDKPVYEPRSIRKSKALFRPIMKVKHHEETQESAFEEDSLNDKPKFEPRRSIRKSKALFRPIMEVKHHDDMQESELEEDSLDDKPHGEPCRSVRTLRSAGKPIKKIKGQSKATLDGYSDGSLDDRSHHQQRISNRTMVIRKTRKLKVKQKEIIDSESEASPDDESEYMHARSIRSPGLEPGTPQWRVSNQFEPVTDDEMEVGTSTRLRRTIRHPREMKTKSAVKRQVPKSKGKKAQAPKNAPARKGPKMRFPTPRTPAIKGAAKKGPTADDDDEEEEEDEFCCDVEGCAMSFGSRQELGLHKRNICPVKGCGKKVFSHKYLVQHRRVHMDDRPLKCPWKGCGMTFKWTWARTEHIRVHTGARPYVCKEPGCGQTFRFVSDFSRHKRKTGHSVKNARK